MLSSQSSFYYTIEALKPRARSVLFRVSWLTAVYVNINHQNVRMVENGIPSADMQINWYCYILLSKYLAYWDHFVFSK